MLQKDVLRFAPNGSPALHGVDWSLPLMASKCSPRFSQTNFSMVLSRKLVRLTCMLSTVSWAISTRWLDLSRPLRSSRRTRQANCHFTMVQRLEARAGQRFMHVHRFAWASSGPNSTTYDWRTVHTSRHLTECVFAHLGPTRPI